MTATTPDYSHLVTLALLAALPIILIICTSFAKVSVVLMIVRNALGADGIPPMPVITGLAVVLSIFIMTPVAQSMIALASSLPDPTGGTLSFPYLKSTWETVSAPLLDFLLRNTPESEIGFFNGLAGLSPGSAPSLRVLLPAFASAELVEAFIIGLLVLIPFLVLDLIVATVLSAMGLQNLSPPIIAFPLKVLLFLAADGWHLLVTGLAVSYGM